MGGFAGIVNDRESIAVSQNERHQLKTRLSQRRGVDCYVSETESTYLAQCTSHTTNESATKGVVSIDGYTCIGDIRLDNRTEILREINQQPQAKLRDEYLIIKGFQKWGTKLPSYLLGDFSFVIWHEPTRRLFSCRDHFGVKPFFYRDSDSSFSFSTEAKIIDPDISKVCSKTRVAAFLLGVSLCPEELDLPDFFRLPAGHFLIWQNGKRNVQRYWHMQPRKDINDTETLIEEFRTTLLKAVEARIPITQTVGCLLSGGLDSSAVTILAESIQRKASRPPIKTYSMIFPANEKQDERFFISEVHKNGHYEPHYINLDDHAPLEKMEELLNEQEGLFGAPGLNRHRNIYKLAERDGAEVLLDGHGGDEVVGSGFAYLYQLAESGNWLKLMSLVPTVARVRGTDPIALFLFLIGSPGTTSSQLGLQQRVARRLRRMRLGNPSTNVLDWRAVVSNEFTEKTEIERILEDRNNAEQTKRTDEFETQIKTLSSPYIGHAFEVLDKTSSSSAIDARYPFYDKRLVEIALAVPPSEKIRVNQTRSVLRRALKSDYPKAIYTRQTKTAFDSELGLGLINHHSPFLNELASNAATELGDYFNIKNLQELIRKSQVSLTSMTHQEINTLWRISCFTIWLKSGGRIKN